MTLSNRNIIRFISRFEVGAINSHLILLISVRRLMWHLVGKIQLVAEEVEKWPPQRNPHEVAVGLAPRGGGSPRKRKEDFPPNPPTRGAHSVI
jgi:hypothetical protein